MLRVQAEEAQRLWAASGADLAHLFSLAGAHVDCAAASAEDLPAFRRQLAAHDVLPGSAAGQLLGRLTELRYLRSDVHATCLAAEGLSGPPARTLHRLWRGFGVGGASSQVVDALAELRLRSRHDGRWSPTDEGVQVCERVEAATNDLFARLLTGVDSDVRRSFLAAIGRVPGEDPRPHEDR